MNLAKLARTSGAITGALSLSFLVSPAASQTFGPRQDLSDDVLFPLNVCAADLDGD